MFYRSLLLGSVFALGACSYVVDKQIQKLTIETPGAYNAICYAYVDGLRYKFRPPQTMTVAQSNEDLVVDCLAPGNRRKKVVIEPHIPGSFYGNVVTGVVPGAAWDYTSDAMFKYPEIVEVNFVNTPTTPESLPAQNKPDIKQPEAYNLEEFRSGLPRLNSDRYGVQSEAKLRERGVAKKSTGYMSETITGADYGGKSAPASVPVVTEPSIQTLGEDMNPFGAPSPQSTDENAPISLFPGE